MAFGPNQVGGAGFPSVTRINATNVITVTPLITSGSAYTSGNQIGGIMILPNAVRQGAGMGFGSSELVSVTILDGSKMDAAMDIWLFNQSPTVTSTDKAAFAMTYANQLLQCVGVVSVGTSYSDAAAVSTSSTVNLNLPLVVPASVTSPQNIYAIAIVRGTPTYTATNALTFRFGIFLD